MCVPMLTPLDTPIFDDDVIAEMEEHSNEDLSCLYDDGLGEWLLRRRCCGEHVIFCGRHRDALHRWIEQKVSIECGKCGKQFPLFAVVGDLLTEVQL